MEEEMRQGMMGADVNTSPAAAQPMELTVSAREVSNNLQNLKEEERELITQLNVPQFRDFMSKVFGPEFGMVMQEAIPEPQVASPQPQQQVSPQGESPVPTQGQGMMTQPPSV
jgi:hypothetical protein